ncbi:hypothetical protein DAEQUDRAFT_26537 [Daedalea quercina L-15889]|uniref:Uncharacterized protein n=1 Tax=Daedalea quercina L-15889 TaxID=1314783 RepID=A0A165SNK8_9APHY|nr:hypothetical protein DAEQUDRAFT_26537 [Daedalea quercina L-15889]
MPATSALRTQDASCWLRRISHSGQMENGCSLAGRWVLNNRPAIPHDLTFRPSCTCLLTDEQRIRVINDQGLYSVSWTSPIDAICQCTDSSRFQPRIPFAPAMACNPDAHDGTTTKVNAESPVVYSCRPDSSRSKRTARRHSYPQWLCAVVCRESIVTAVSAHLQD